MDETYSPNKCLHLNGLVHIYIYIYILAIIQICGKYNFALVLTISSQIARSRGRPEVILPVKSLFFEPVYDFVSQKK